MTGKIKFHELIERGRQGKNIGLDIGMPKMARYMDGYMQGTYYLIGGASGTGKSTLVLYSLIYRPLMQFINGEYQDRDPYWILFNLEMTQPQLYAKLISMYIFEQYGIQLTFGEIFSRGKDKTLSDEHYDLIKQCDNFLDILDERLICHEGSLNAEKYKREVLEDLTRFGTFIDDETYEPYNPNQVVAILIDHMSLIRAPAGVSKKDEMDRISAYGVYLRNKCNIVSIINIMQFNRDSNNQERLKQSLQEPNSSDFKDSGTMYEDANIVFALYAPIKFKLATYRKYNIRELGQCYLACILLKSRFGTSDIVDSLGFYGDCSTYRELPSPDKIIDYDKYKDPSWNEEEHKDSTSTIIIEL